MGNQWEFSLSPGFPIRLQALILVGNETTALAASFPQPPPPVTVPLDAVFPELTVMHPVDFDETWQGA